MFRTLSGGCHPPERAGQREQRGGRASASVRHLARRAPLAADIQERTDVLASAQAFGKSWRTVAPLASKSRLGSGRPNRSPGHAAARFGPQGVAVDEAFVLQAIGPCTGAPAHKGASGGQRRAAEVRWLPAAAPADQAGQPAALQARPPPRAPATRRLKLALTISRWTRAVAAAQRRDRRARCGVRRLPVAAGRPAVHGARSTAAAPPTCRRPVPNCPAASRPQRRPLPCFAAR